MTENERIVEIEKPFAFCNKFEWQSAKAADAYKFLIVVSNSVVKLTKCIETFFLCKSIIFIYLKQKKIESVTQLQTLIYFVTEMFIYPALFLGSLRGVISLQPAIFSFPSSHHNPLLFFLWARLAPTVVIKFTNDLTLRLDKTLLELQQI